LRHAEPGIRQASAKALGDLGSPDAIPALIAALSDETWEVRRAGVRSLGRVLSGSAAAQAPPATTRASNNTPSTTAYEDPVATALTGSLGDEAWQVRQATAEVLIQVDPQIADQAVRDHLSATLLARLGDERSPVRKAVAQALAGLEVHGLEPFREALNDSDWRRREGAVLALGCLGQRAQASVLKDQLVPLLVSALADPDLRIRLAAVGSLGQIGRSLEEPQLRLQVLRPLAASLADRDKQIRESSARALGRTGDARAVEPLVTLLQDPDESVKTAAAEALDRLARAQGIQTGPVRAR
jgi:HEAT repeat protein